MSKLTPDELLESPQWQEWIARVFPMLYITTLTLLLPTLLTQSFVVSEFGAIQEQKLQHQLRSISIKILAHGETIGAGVLLARQEQVYTVITNAHVIQTASVPFQLQTYDGQIYAAALITPPIGQNRDLSILRFQSPDRIYNTAKLATNIPQAGDRVWSSGFPIVGVGVGGASASAEASAEASLRRRTLRERNENRANDSSKQVWEPNIIGSQITQILPIAIAGGYSIGSDRPIEQGMSGGPMIDRSGSLIGINGIHPNPLWNSPEVLEDGSKVGDVLQEQIKNSNWAIPIDFIKEYARL
jgi:S1-C subfamily serine protease